MAKIKTPVEGEVKEVKKRKRTSKKVVEETVVETTPVKKVRKPRVKKVVEPVVVEAPVAEPIVVNEPVVVTMEEVDKKIPYSVPESKHIKHTQENTEENNETVEVPGQLKRHGLSGLFAKMFNRVIGK